jgi:hypothetical protein
MKEVKLEVEFTGKAREPVAETLSFYFGRYTKTTKSGCPSAYTFVDKYGRNWRLDYDAHVDAITGVAKHIGDETVFQNKLVTPFLYIESDDDMKTLHDVLLTLKVSGCIINSSCAMHISIKKPYDDRMVGLYFAEYTKFQFGQIEKFEVSPNHMQKYARLYEFQTDGYEFDDSKDVIDYINATYAPVPNCNPVFAQNFALNFMRCPFDGTIEFRAFNSSFDDKDVMLAVDWIRAFTEHCERVWYGGWLKKHESLRI